MRIGIFLPNWIGDVVMATPALRAVRKHFGQQAQVVGIMRPYVQQVLAGTNWLDECLVYDRRSVARGAQPDQSASDSNGVMPCCC